MTRRILAAILSFIVVLAFVAADAEIGFAASKKARQQQQQGGFFSRLLGLSPPPQQPSRKYRPGFGNPFLFQPPGPLFGDQGSVFQRQKRPKKARKSAPSEPPLVTVEVQAKDPNARKILVIGDFVAGGLAWGLDQSFAEEPKLAVIDDSKDGSGLVRPDFYDWNKSLPEILNTEKPDLVIVAVGVNDRQQMRTENQRFAVRSAQWEKAYTARIDGLVDTLKVYGKPFFWVSAPPVRASAGSVDMAYLNGLYEPRVKAAGGSYVDIWIGFTDANGQYISTGPDLDGQVRQLRTSDGVNFTRAGKMKLAFYVERDVRQKTGVGAGTVDLLPPASQTSTIEIGPDGRKRLVGPVMSLSDPLPGASDTLAGGPPEPVAVSISGPSGAAAAAISAAATAANKPLSSDADSAQFRMVVKGEALPPTPGRVDDFAWPPGSRPAAPLPPSADASPHPVQPTSAAIEPPAASRAN